MEYNGLVELLTKHKTLAATIVALMTVLVGFIFWAPPILQSSNPNAPSQPAAANTAGDWTSPTSTATTIPVPTALPLFQYIEVLDSCGVHYEGICVNLRSGPGVEYPGVSKLRTGIVLKVEDTVTVDGKVWYKIAFDEGVRYPERVTGDWYVSADYVQSFTDEGDKVSYAGITIENNKRIIVDISEQTLYAYDSDTLFMQESISTGLEFTPTPRGTFIIYKKTPSRYMQGPMPDVSDDYYDLPGVPWDLYFTYEGAVIHGAYWHDNFGEPWSHGCVNLPPQKAKELYQWAEVGTPVTVRN